MEKCLRSLDKGIIGTRLHINKKPAINTVSSNFLDNWETNTSRAEKDIVFFSII